jgi:hypothetical protein
LFDIRLEKQSCDKSARFELSKGFMKEISGGIELVVAGESFIRQQERLRKPYLFHVWLSFDYGACFGAPRK